MAVSGVNSLNLSDLTNMEVALSSNQQLEAAIDATSKNYHTIDVSLAMTNLGNVGDVLKLAYAGSKGFSCSTSTLKILSRYQSMIKNSYVTTSSFVGACLKALQLHKLALVMAEKEKMDSSVKMIEKCADLAKEMAKESEKLVNEATELCKLSEEALLTAQNDENVSKEEKERIKKSITESRARQAEMEVKTKQLHEEIEEHRLKLAELAKKADEERQKEFFLKILSCITEPIGKLADSAGKVSGQAVGTMTGANITNAVANAAAMNAMKEMKVPLQNNQTDQPTETTTTTTTTSTKSDMNNNMSGSACLAEQENVIMKLKADVQKQEREANAEIAKIGETLKGLTEQHDDLTASIVSLEMAIKALGKVKTTFEHTRQFWLGVEKHCKDLTDVSTLQLMNDPVFKTEFIEALRTSGLSWLSLGKINYTAQRSISNVDKRTDNILSNLPTKMEALEIVKTDADKIINSLQNEVSVS